MLVSLFEQLHAALPQTQCTRCGYPDCAAYAEAMASAQADINQCPPGGAEGVARLAALTGRPARPLSPEHGTEGPRQVAFIDEAWCIGCTLCLKACPTDAIVGSNKQMHTVIESECTGCELCIPVCPVDCIELENASGTLTGWAAWSEAQAQQALQRYQQRQTRTAREQAENEARLRHEAEAKLKDMAAHSRLTDPAVLERKRALIEAALAKSRAQRQAVSGEDAPPA
ncbi:electron transport complex subunit RsxB [Curvibacter sp. HBC61]|uniref:Electron transport complex subunit RsxB n=1 Tax=Curvibacter cyanobacteriorum TaxID=3026422 RepID=A0ABT5MW45_9BURK|nr:electron transport complex subunit RsxB [Curvibacter sp. HBC61]MDD0838130.1 electron transport complex subunit RsxB [Curvibacter sp. HBC61]